MIGDIYQWIRTNFFTKLELTGGVLDMRYYTITQVNTALANKINKPTGLWTTDTWGKGLTLVGDYVIQWLKGGSAISRGVGYSSDGNLYVIRSTADNDSAAAVYDLIMDSSGNVHMNGNHRVVGGLEVSNVGEFTPSPGGIAAGRRNVNYTPTTSNWSDAGCTILLTGENHTVIGFHDADSRVDFIRVGAGVITLGYNGGFGAAYTEMAAGAAISKGSSADGTLVIRGTGYNTHFHYGSNEDNYIRPGTIGGKTMINDVNTGDIEVGGGGGALIVWSRLGTAWSGLSFGSGWTDYGGDYQAGQYKKVGDMVFLRGLVKRTSGTGTTIATLPAGYRPPARCLYGVHTSALSGADRVDVLASGEIYLSSGSVDYVQLDGLCFSTLS